MARKILLADDSVTAQNMGRKILADAGYEVITVNNGSAALKKIAELKPDVIVLDVYMPGYSGLEVCQRLKEVGETARIPILLTVGKLEPFKQEEVKRVRADGFIVKPFEASELLSALSKLEDRIVPRSESSKPGRFARATAALEDGRYDKTVAIEEDSGWKNRIAFPSKKHEEEKETPAEIDDPAIYNPVNKDLRTVVEHRVAAPPSAVSVEPERVDLGALAPLGLPKDVTPEEIAALAAAAAQVQGKIAENAIAESKTAVSSPEAASPAEVSLKAENKEEIATPIDSKPEPVTSPAAFAESKPQEPVEAKETVAPPAASTAHVAEASTVLESRSESNQATSSANEPSSASKVEIPVDEPVTMAMAGIAQSSAGSSRWTAVSVALAPEDAGVSLEQEMQKASASYATAEAGHSASLATAAPESDLGATEIAPAIENKLPEALESVPPTVAPAVTDHLTEVATAAAEAISAVAPALEAVATSFVAPAEVASTESREFSAPADSESPSSPAPAETSTEKEIEAAAPTMEAEKPNVEAEISSAQHESSAAEEEPSPKVLSNEEPKVSAPAEAAPSANASEVRKEAVASTASQMTVTESKTEMASETDHIEPETAKESHAANEPHKPQEPDFAASTAAAWASWHRVRESGTHDAAAKAVAAGAESSPNDVSAEGSDADVANIVDSVLADLRPKIVEEISRKLGKKK